jgi:hypothetical protein
MSVMIREGARRLTAIELEAVNALPEDGDWLAYPSILGPLMAEDRSKYPDSTWQRIFLGNEWRYGCDGTLCPVWLDPNPNLFDIIEELRAHEH